MARLAGRRVLITGGASGIGLAIARLFAAEGARLAMLDVDRKTLAAAARCCGDGVVAEAADVSDEAEVGAAVARMAEALGGLDGLVNAAGTSLWRSIAETTYAEWRRVLSVNLDGSFLVCRAAIPALRASGAGTIVNIASGAALRPKADFGAYSCSKAALVMLSKTLAIELAEAGIRVNAICPGVIQTPMIERTLSRSPDRTARTAQYLRNQLMGRFGTAEEIAKAALFLSDSESSFTTGAILTADGGASFH